MFRAFDAVRANIRKRLLILLVLLGAITVSLSAGSVLAETEFWSHGNSNEINGCVDRRSGALRIVKKTSECTFREYGVSLASADAVEALTNQVDELDSRVGELEAAVAALDLAVPACLSEENGDAVFEGCNVHVRNGDGSTATKNGTGNLIVGYNENNFGYNRDGSHNVVVGIDHGYKQYGGLVVGKQNRINGNWSSVTGGSGNKASGNESSVSGGFNNEASGTFSSVIGGNQNLASGNWSSVSGGSSNEARNEFSSVSGGSANIASGPHSSVSGGRFNEASGLFSSVSGGDRRTAAGAANWAAGSLFEAN